MTNLISGAGGFTVKCRNVVNILNPNNTFQGPVVMSGVSGWYTTLNVKGLNGVPSARSGGIYGTAGRVNFDLSEEPSVTDADLLAIWRGISTNSTLESMLTPTSSDTRGTFVDFAVDTGDDYTFTSPIAGPVVVAHGGTGTLTIASANVSDTPNFVNHDGTLVLDSAGSRMDAGWIDV